MIARWSLKSPVRPNPSQNPNVNLCTRLAAKRDRILSTHVDR